MIKNEFVRAATIDQAVALLAEHKEDCALIAGGTDLMVAMHKGGTTARHLIHIGNLEALRCIREDNGSLRIGSAVTHAECMAEETVKRYAPILAKACSSVGTPQIRNRGTLGGNIISAAACADTVPALVVLNSKCLLKSANGTRELKISELITGPNQTLRASNEICTEIVAEKMPAGARYEFIKLIRRKSGAKSRLAVAVIAAQDKLGKVSDIRISVGSTTPIPQRFTSAEQLLLGKAATEDLIQAAGAEVSAAMIAVTGYRWSTEYKKLVVETLTARALRAVLEVKR